MTMISCGVEISIAGGVDAMVRVLSLGLFFFFLFFFFCNHALFVSRYKKPHAALAMERTKAINQKHKQRKVTAPVNIHCRAGFSSAGPSAYITRKAQTNNLVVW